MRKYLLLFVAVLVGAFLWIRLSPTPAPPPKDDQVVVPVPPEVKPPDVPPEVKPPTEIKTYRDALLAARTLKKPMFLYFGAEWCAPCKRMKADTLVHPDVKKKLESYVFLIIDADKEKDLATKYKVKSLPTYMVVTEWEVVQMTASGFKTHKEFLKWLR